MIQSIGETGEVITTSQYQRQLLGQIDIPFDEHSSLLDTPSYSSYRTHYLAEKNEEVLPQEFTTKDIPIK